MGNFIQLITGLIAGMLVGFVFVPTYKSPRNENLGLDQSDRKLRIGGGILYSIVFIVFFCLTVFKQ